jgi:hypothetical protein
MVRMDPDYAAQITAADGERARRYLTAWRTVDTADPCTDLSRLGGFCGLPALHDGDHRDHWTGTTWQ